MAAELQRRHVHGHAGREPVRGRRRDLLHRGHALRHRRQRRSRSTSRPSTSGRRPTRSRGRPRWTSRRRRPAIIWTAPDDRHGEGDPGAPTGSATFTVTNFTRDAQWGDQGRPDAGVRRDRPRSGPMTAAELRSSAPRRHRAARPRRERAQAAGQARAVPRPRRRGGEAGTARRHATAGTAVDQEPEGELERDGERLPGARPAVQHGRRGPAAPGCTTDLNVVFGADRRVSALIYSGRGRSAKGVGVGSSRRAVRAAYPGVTCVDVPRAGRNCTLNSTYRSRTVKTVFHFKNGGGPAQVRPGADVLRRRAARGGGA